MYKFTCYSAWAEVRFWNIYIILGLGPFTSLKVMDDCSFFRPLKVLSIKWCMTNYNFLMVRVNLTKNKSLTYLRIFSKEKGGIPLLFLFHCAFSYLFRVPVWRFQFSHLGKAFSWWYNMLTSKCPHEKQSSQPSCLLISIENEMYFVRWQEMIYLLVWVVLEK